jgi:hypothetical protein
MIMPSVCGGCCRSLCGRLFDHVAPAHNGARARSRLGSARVARPVYGVCVQGSRETRQCADALRARTTGLTRLRARTLTPLTQQTNASSRASSIRQKVYDVCQIRRTLTPQPAAVDQSLPPAGRLAPVSPLATSPPTGQGIDLPPAHSRSRTRKRSGHCPAGVWIMKRMSMLSLWEHVKFYVLLSQEETHPHKSCGLSLTGG